MIEVFPPAKKKILIFDNHGSEHVQNSFSRLQDLEYERLEDTINLTNLIFEELSLNTPEYPKLKHMEKYSKILNSLQSPSEGFKSNPFSALKNFEAKNKVKTN